MAINSMPRSAQSESVRPSSSDIIAGVAAAGMPRATSSIELTQQLLAYFGQSNIAPGQRLPGERLLAEQLGVGRNVLRESLKLLTVLGFLEVRHGDGTFLTNRTSNLLPRIVEWGLFLGDHSLDELVEARATMEVALAEMAARKAGPTELITIEQLFSFMEDAAHDDDVERYAASDTNFHLAIAKASGNSVLEGVMVNIRSLVQAWTEQVLQSHVNVQDSLELHRPIMEAIRAQNPAAARDAMQRHMDVALQNLRVLTEPSATEPS